MLSQHRRR